MTFVSNLYDINVKVIKINITVINIFAIITLIEILNITFIVTLKVLNSQTHNHHPPSQSPLQANISKKMAAKICKFCIHNYHKNLNSYNLKIPVYYLSISLMFVMKQICL